MLHPMRMDYWGMLAPSSRRLKSSETGCAERRVGLRDNWSRIRLKIFSSLADENHQGLC